MQSPELIRRESPTLQFGAKRLQAFHVGKYTVPVNDLGPMSADGVRIKVDGRRAAADSITW